MPSKIDFLAFSLSMIKASPLGIVTGNPGVFQDYPDPYLVKTHTQRQGTGFTGYGYRYLLGYIDMGWVGQYRAGQVGGVG
jgi:hypothetical protein